MKTNLFKLLSLTGLAIIPMSSAYAGKLDAMLGFYSFNATVQNKSASFSGLGAYEMSYLIPFKNHFELVLGYSLTMTDIIGGDFSYGPKIGINYFPLNFSSNEKIILPNQTIDIQDFYKPYVGLNFSQKQFQSAKTSFAGFGVSVGMEKYINQDYTIKAEVKMNNYSGPSGSTAKEMNLLVGMLFNF